MKTPIRWLAEQDLMFAEHESHIRGVVYIFAWSGLVQWTNVPELVYWGVAVVLFLVWLRS